MKVQVGRVQVMQPSITIHQSSEKFFINIRILVKDIYFDIQVTNEDATSSVGRQTVILKDCNLDGGILTKFDADAEYLNENIDFTFEDFENPWKIYNASRYAIKIERLR